MPIFLMELYKYTKKELIDKLFLSNAEYIHFEYELMKKGILKIYNNKLSIKYVGVIEYKGKVIFILPKYIRGNNEAYYLEKAKLIFTLFREYSSRNKKCLVENIDFFGNEYNQESFNLIAMSEYLLRNYLEYGIYNKNIHLYEINGHGNIDWNKTVNEQYAYKSNNSYIYINTYTDSRNNDLLNNIVKIHKYAINICSEYISKFKFLGIEIPDIKFDIDIYELGTKDEILLELEKEMSTEFCDQKLLVLQCLHNLFNKIGSTSSDENNVNLYGTKYFHIVWEKVCSYVFKNQYSSIAKDIDKPKWYSYDLSKEYEADETLKPDILRKFDLQRLMCILDAKYYNIDFEESKIKNYPGIGDITKQYLYEQALKVKYSGYEFLNILVFPTEQESKIFGTVDIDFMSKLNLSKVNLYKVNDVEVFNMYINRNLYDDAILLDLYKPNKNLYDTDFNPVLEVSELYEDIYN
ncbi:LlaJI family restriction endonuclease [Paraclostridium bifermentans]|uniref:LlaJI family restriction endonuclease n=1 Tax=Paraclostridium bifermentans TaxID=1490 RepID=A0AA44DKJ9_PARBF|nr:LlaJI family restriction endonuclease [Paraclostridium bifermentans]NME09454.1 LlaJI family restriction endonuclease [Paraclostridium bifermentans]